MFKIYIYWVKKRLVWGVLDIEEIRDKDNETGLKERRVIEIKTTSAFHIRDARFHSLLYFTYLIFSRLYRHRCMGMQQI